MIQRLPQRIQDRIDVRPNGCWLWTGALNHNGYGHVGFQHKTWRVHRLVYTLLVGAIPPGLQLDHVVCGTRHCCNPDHVEMVTEAENKRRGNAGKINNHNAKKTHCLRGHPLVQASFGRRVCRQCRLEAQQRYAGRRAE